MISEKEWQAFQGEYQAISDNGHSIYTDDKWLENQQEPPTKKDAIKLIEILVEQGHFSFDSVFALGYARLIESTIENANLGGDVDKGLSRLRQQGIPDYFPNINALVIDHLNKCKRESGQEREKTASTNFNQKLIDEN